MTDRPLPLPETGKYKVSDWSDIVGMTEETIKEYIKKHEIPSIRIGHLHFIDASAWWSSNPPSVTNGTKKRNYRKS